MTSEPREAACHIKSTSFGLGSPWKVTPSQKRRYRTWVLKDEEEFFRPRRDGNSFREGRRADAKPQGGEGTNPECPSRATFFCVARRWGCGREGPKRRSEKDVGGSVVPHGACRSQSCFPQRPSTGRWVGGRCNSPEIRCEAHLEAAQWSQGRLGEGAGEAGRLTLRPCLTPEVLRFLCL